jgi:hypothetical protein
MKLPVIIAATIGAAVSQPASATLTFTLSGDYSRLSEPARHITAAIELDGGYYTKGHPESVTFTGKTLSFIVNGIEYVTVPNDGNLYAFAESGGFFDFEAISTNTQPYLIAEFEGAATPDYSSQAFWNSLSPPAGHLIMGGMLFGDIANFALQVSGTVPPLTQLPVPEPASWLMIVGGFGAIGGAMRKRRLKNHQPVHSL